MAHYYRYKNTADKQTTWFVIFFLFIALTVALIAAFIIESIKENTFIIVFFSTFIPLAIGFTILALYITSSKKKAIRGIKKLEAVISSYEKEYKVLKNVEGLDYLLLTPYEIYGFLVKNFEGNISGMETDKVWRQSLAFQKIKNALPNPITEAKELCDSLAKKLNVEIEPVVVLVSGNRGYINSTHLYSPNQLVELISTQEAVKYKDEDLEVVIKKLQ